MTREAAYVRVVRTTQERQRVTLESQPALDAAMNDQRDAIRDALAAGGTTTELVRITGLSRARIYQIRDNRR